MKKTVLAAGAFDLIHYGHLKYLEEAKKKGEPNAELIVVVARDSTIEKRKGRKPVIPEEQRRMLVEALKPVDKAILGSEKLNLEHVIAEVKPDVITLGYDQNDLYQKLKTLLRGRMDIQLVKVEKFEVGTVDSSSKIKRRVAEEWKRL